MASILESLSTRLLPLQPEELETLAYEVSRAETEREIKRNLRRVEQSGLVTRDGFESLEKMARGFGAGRTNRQLMLFDGALGREANGHLVNPATLKFKGIRTDHNVVVYVFNRFSAVADRLLTHPDFERYFRASDSTMTKTLALARVVIDFEAEDLKDVGLKSEQERTLLAWELLARIDFELDGLDPQSGLISQKLLSDYKTLKGFIEASGLHPMSQRALAVRDGRDKPFAVFSGQGSNYLTELRDLIANEKSAKALYNEFKPLFAQYNIDLDFLLTLADADHQEIENYYLINGIATSLPVVGLTQVLRARVMEDYGYNFYEFVGVAGQSGGQPAASFTAGAFEAEGYLPPLVPTGLGGYHTLQAYRNFIEWMLVEGGLMQKPNPVRYAPDIQRMEPLVERNKPLPSSQEIDAYFAKYQVANLSISGIPYNSQNPESSDLGKIIAAINAKFPESRSYIFMSNLNTGPTLTGKNSYFILVGGKGPALAELAKMIILKEAPGYSDEIQSIVAGWKENKNVGMPISNTRLSFAPHDPHDLQASLVEHLEIMERLGIKLSRPRISLIHNLTGADISKASGDQGEILARQQYVEVVDMPRVISESLIIKPTFLIDMGTGAYQSKTALPANLQGSPVDVVGVIGDDTEGVAGWSRLTTTDSRKAYRERGAVDEQAQESASKKLASLEGLTVREVEDQFIIRFDSPLPEEQFQTFKELFFGIDPESPIFKLLQAERIISYGSSDKKPLIHLIRNQANMEYILHLEKGAVKKLEIREKGRPSVEVGFWPDGYLAITEGIGAKSYLTRLYARTDEGFNQIALDEFRKTTRIAFAEDWKLSTTGIKKEDLFSDEQEVSVERMVHFADGLKSRDDKYLNPDNPDFQAHPHFLIELMWKAMITPAFVEEFDLDFTRVIDEGKSIRLGVPIRPGDIITSKARIAHVEDFRLVTYEGRRILVKAVAKNQKGEIVGVVSSTLVSRILTGLVSGETRVLFENREAPPTIDFFAGKNVYENTKVNLVAKGSLVIPPDLPDTYYPDPNRIHLSELSAVLAGFPKGRIMQGLATLAFVNEQVISQLQRDGLARTIRGVSNLRFLGVVLPGEELEYELTRKGHAEGDHRFEVVVKKAGGGKVFSYDLITQGPKTAVIMTGQGSHYVGMGEHLRANADSREMIEVLQSWIPIYIQSGKPMVDLLEEMDALTKENLDELNTAKAQPMIMSYEAVLFIDALFDGVIPDDASYSGHSLGMWSAIFVALIQDAFRTFKAEGRVFNSKKEFLVALELILKPVIVGVCMRGASMGKYADSNNPQGLLAVRANDGIKPLSPRKIRLLQEFINQEGDPRNGNHARILELANDNDPVQLVLGGHRSALALAQPILKAWGYSTAILPVNNAFHTSLMAPASHDFGEWMKTFGNPFAVPNADLYMDIEGDTLAEIAKEKGMSPLDVLSEIMTRQISSGVEWRKTVRKMLQNGVRRFIEVGPGEVLSKMVAREAKALGIQGKIEIVFANRFRKPDQWEKVTFDTEQGLSEYHKPRVIPPTPEEIVEEPVVQAPPPASVSTTAGPTVAQVPEISSAQLKTVIDGFFADHSLGNATDKAPLAQQLAEQIVALGEGVRGALQQRLALASSVSTAAEPVASAPSVEDQIIDYFKSSLKRSDVTSASNLTDDLNVGSSALADDLTELNRKLGAKISADAFEGVQKLTIQVVADKYKAAGAKGGSALAEAPLPVSPEIEKKALQVALSLLPVYSPAPAAPVPASFQLVLMEQVEGVRSEFVAQNQAAISSGNGAPLADSLAEKYQRLGPGAMAPLQSVLDRLLQGGVASPVEQAPSAPSIEDQIIDYFKSSLKRSDVTSASNLTDDLNVGSSALADDLTELNRKLGVKVSADAFEGVQKLTIQVVADKYKAAGAKGGTGATSSPAFPAVAAVSPADELNRLAIQKVLPSLQSQAVAHGTVSQAVTIPHGTFISGGIDSTQVAELKQMVFELERRIAVLEGAKERTRGEMVDLPVQVTADGTVVDARDAEIAQLREVISNIVKGTSNAFVYGLMQPHYKDVSIEKRVFTFGEITRNGGGFNLMKFIIALRMGRLPSDDYDLKALIVERANQLDEIALGWLKTFIANEQTQGRLDRVAILEMLYQLAEDNLQNNTLTTSNVITVKGVNFVPEYGSPHRVVPVPRSEGTTAHVDELKPLADPKTAEDLDYMLGTGYDLRGVKVLVQQAGTMSGPAIEKLGRFGATLDISERLGRSDIQPNGQNTNDYLWHLVNDHGARGAQLNVIAGMQPGNPHDEQALIDYYDSLCDRVKRYEELDSPQKKALWEQLAKAVNIDLVAGIDLTKEVESLTDEQKMDLIIRILPQIYINGGAFPDYSVQVEKRGDPLSVLSILSLSSRFIALNLAKLHQKYKTGKQVIFMNYYSPNNAGNISEEEGELLPTVIPGSGTYPTAKAALGVGMTAGEALANGLVWSDGRPILLQVDHKTGWGKSNGEAASIMSGNDWYTMELERLALLRGFKLLTLTGDQLATVHIAGVLAMFAGPKKGDVHLLYDDTFGFDEAARRGILAELMAEAMKNEGEKHKAAKEAWEANQEAERAKINPADLYNDGSIIDLNNLNIAISGETSGPYSRQDGDIVFSDETPAVVGYGLVSPLGPDALSSYRGMLANGRFKGREGFGWLGEYDFYNLARSMGIDVSKWDYQTMAESVGLGINDMRKNRGSWQKAFQQFLIDHSGFQQLGEFMEFELLRGVTYTEDTEIEVSDPLLITKMAAHGYEFFKRPDGSLYALAKAGQTYKLPMTYKLPVTIFGALPGQSYKGFNFDGFGYWDRMDSRPEAHGAQVAKMATAQMMMSMGTDGPQAIEQEFGKENIFVVIGTGKGDSKPNVKSIIHPYSVDDKVVNYIMAALLPDAVTGQVATEQLGAEGMALAVIAACSTGNANIIMAIRDLFSRYYLATKKSGEVDWPEVFTKLYIAGGVDYALSFDAIMNFDELGALLRDDWRKAFDLVLSHGSRPDDKERGNFVIGTGGGGQALTTLYNAKNSGKPVYGMAIGAGMRTDGNKVGKAREGYGPGQGLSLFEAWDQAREYLTDVRYTKGQVRGGLGTILTEILEKKFTYNNEMVLEELSLKRSERAHFLQEIKQRFGVTLEWNSIKTVKGKGLINTIHHKTRSLKPNVKFIVMGHKTSTVAGDPYEEKSLKKFLSTILPEGQFAHLVATKAHFGHALGGSSGIDSGLSPLVLRYLGIPGVPGLDNVMEEAGENVWLLHHKDALNLNELYEEDTIYVVIREAAGFNAKNTAIFEVKGKVPFENEVDAIVYTAKLVEHYVEERTQRRAERTGLRKMAFNLNTYPEVSKAQYRDLFELSLRSEAVARELIAGKKLDFENILNWIYRFPVNPSVRKALAVDSKAKGHGPKPEVQLNQYNAIKYAEAYDGIVNILASYTPRELAEIGRMAREKGWDKQTVVFYGISDGMGLRTLLALIASGAVKEVVGIHLDAPTDNPDPSRWAVKGSSFNPEILKAYAAAKGVNLKVINTNGILYDFKTGEPLPLQEEIISSVEASRSRSEVKEILFFDYVAFGAPWRRHTDSDMWVPSINEYGQLSYVKVSKAKNEAQGIAMTINPMGHNHVRLLSQFLERGWLGEKSVTTTADWWGSESADMLSGVYGGALLGDAKNVAKQETARFAHDNPRSGFHGYFGYPAFLSFALNAIPGGTLTGLIGKRIYEDIQNGMVIEGISSIAELRFYSMEELAIGAVTKLLQGNLTGPHGNKLAMDEAEKVIAREIDRRFKQVGEQLRTALEDKRQAFFTAHPTAQEGDFKGVLTVEESYALLKDVVPEDYLDVCHINIKDVGERKIVERRLLQDKKGIEPLPLPEILRTDKPFFMRAYSKAMNSPDLAIKVIDAGGVGTLAADDLTPAELGSRILRVQAFMGEDAPLIINVLMSNPNRDQQIEVILKMKPAAVSFGNGFVSEELVHKFHEAGILVIQLVGTTQGIKSVAEKGVDLVIVERNYGPGHIHMGEGPTPEKLIKEARQALYDYGIPVIAGGGFVDFDDVQKAFHWGASAIQLDDPIAYAVESTYAAKEALKQVNLLDPVLILKDAEGKPLRVLNTEGAQWIRDRLEKLAEFDLEEERKKPMREMVFREGFESAAKGDVKRGLFLAGERIGQINTDETIEEIFRRLSGQDGSKPTPPEGGGGSQLEEGYIDTAPDADFVETSELAESAGSATSATSLEIGDNVTNIPTPQMQAHLAMEDARANIYEDNLQPQPVADAGEQDSPVVDLDESSVTNNGQQTTDDSPLNRMARLTAQHRIGRMAGRTSTGVALRVLTR